MADADNIIRYAEISFSPSWVNQALACPNCGEATLHHGTVTVFSRFEDAPEFVTKIGFEWPDDRLPPLDAVNPSTRRHGLTIAFWCECCFVRAELTIAQHKGATLTGWRYVPT